MSSKPDRVRKQLDRTPERQRELEKIRAQFQKNRPSLDELIAEGDVLEVVSQGEYLDLHEMLAALKSRRESEKLSLSDVAERCGMDKAALSRLENGVYLNPTVDTIYRYANALGVEIGFCLKSS